MLVEFLRRWRCHKPGDKFDLPDGVANVVISHGWARRVEQTANEEPREQHEDSERPKARSRR